MILAGFMVLLIVLAWHLGRILEVALPKFPALSRRVTYMFLAYELIRLPLERLLRALF